MSALAGGDCIDDADALRAGGTGRVLGFSGQGRLDAGHVPAQLPLGPRAPARPGQPGAAQHGPGPPVPDPVTEPLTIDLDSTICETYGLKKEGGTAITYTQVRGYHPLLAVAAGTGDVLMARLREGRCEHRAAVPRTSCAETIGRVRYAGATGQLTMRADSGFYAHAVVAVCRAMDVRFSITVRQHRGLRRLIEAIPEEAWTPIPYWIEGGADVAETAYTPFASEKDAAPVRLIVRRVKPTPGCQLALLTALRLPRLHHRPRWRHPRARGRPPSSRRDRERHPRPQVRRGPEPSAVGTLRCQRRLAGGAGDGPRRGALDEPHRPGCRHRHHQDPATSAVRPARSAHPLGPAAHAAPAGPLAVGDRLGAPRSTRHPGHPAAA